MYNTDSCTVTAAVAYVDRASCVLLPKRRLFKSHQGRGLDATSVMAPAIPLMTVSSSFKSLTVLSIRLITSQAFIGVCKALLLLRYERCAVYVYSKAGAVFWIDAVVRVKRCCAVQAGVFAVLLI